MLKKMSKSLIAVVLSALMVITCMDMRINANGEERVVGAISITPIASNSVSERSFVIRNNTANNLEGVEYWTTANSNRIIVSIPANGSKTVNVVAADNLTFIANYGGSRTQISAYHAYNMPVNYVINGVVVESKSIVNVKGAGASHEAPLTYNYQGVTYKISGYNYKTAAFGDANLTFVYEPASLPDKVCSVVYVDQNGISIAKKSFVVSEKNGGSFKPDPTIEFNNKSYRLMSGQAASLNPSYNQAGGSYTYRYMLTSDETQRAYNITIQYVSNGMVLDTKRVSVSPSQTISYDTSKTIVNNGVEYERSSGSAATINHAYDNATRTYVVNYDRVKVSEAYNITVNYVNLANGNVVRTDKKEVGINKTVSYNVESSFTEDGSTYLLSGDQARTIKHSFGDTQTSYNIYYHKKGEEVSEYPVSVVYFNVTTNSVITSTTLPAKLNETLSITVPSTFEQGGNSYVLLGGQSTSTDHSFYAARRRYIFIYRDVNDIANADTIVQPGTDGGSVVTPGGDVITVTDDGDLVIEREDGDLELNEDNEVVEREDTPLADNEKVEKDKTPKSKGISQQTMIIGGVIGVGAIIGLAALLIVLKKRKEQAAK